MQTGGYPIHSAAFAKLAEMVVGPKMTGIVELGEAIAARNWETVTSFRQWDSDSEIDLLVYAIARRGRRRHDGHDSMIRLNFTIQ